MKKTIFLAIALSALLSIPACGDDAASQLILETGTVRFIPLEGGFYGIIGDNGQNYDPINLKDEFMTDGLRIRFLAKKRDDIAGIHMWGTIIEIVEIEQL